MNRHVKTGMACFWHVEKHLEAVHAHERTETATETWLHLPQAQKEQLQGKLQAWKEEHDLSLPEPNLTSLTFQTAMKKEALP